MSDTTTMQALADLGTLESQIEELIRRRWWASVPLTTFPASSLLTGEQRLDGGFYADRTFLALSTIRESGYDVDNLGSLCQAIYYPSRFKRSWAVGHENRLPFLGSVEILHLNPQTEKYLSINRTKDIDELQLSEGAILVTRSGSIGRVGFVNRTLSGFVASEHVIRLIPNVGVLSGYLYAFLSSKIGQALIQRNTFGSAISEVEPHHLSGIFIPNIPQKAKRLIHNRIMKSYKLRDEASDLLKEANELIHDLLGLPHFDEDLIEYYHESSESEIPIPQSFIVKATDLLSRLDGSYHVPIARTAINLITRGKYEAVQLGSIVSRIYVAPRFQRIYVPKEYGVPLLQGSHIPQMKPIDLKYISNSQTEGLDRWIIKEGWVLVTCSGTIGRVGLVPTAQDGWAASQHILRIVAKEKEEVSHPGYVAAFLSTPYGQHQLTSKIYGAVVDELTEADTEAVWIPNAPYDIQKQIGERVVQAFEKKEQANKIEEGAIKQLEEIIGGGQGQYMNDTEPNETELEQDTDQMEWDFEPTLGYEIEPELTREEFEGFLTRLSVPREDKTDPKKKGT